MNYNRILYSTSREDSRLEIDLIERCQGQDAIRSVLMPGRGGCHAFDLRSHFPDLKIVIAEPQKDQVELIQHKAKVLSEKSEHEIHELFNVGNQNWSGLTQCGNTESIFRSLRYYVNEFVADDSEWQSFFAGEANRNFLIDLMSSHFWPLGYELFFHDFFLAPINDDEPDEFEEKPLPMPTYFRQRLEDGLKRDDALENFYLHHIFLGQYLAGSPHLPDYLNEIPRKSDFHIVEKSIRDMGSYGEMDLINLSNELDWVTPQQARVFLQQLAMQMKSGAWIVWRQLNNPANLAKEVSNQIEFDWDESARELERDRSLVYNKICIGRKK